MNFSSEISEYEKEPKGFYFDMNMTDSKNCNIKIIDNIFSSTLEIDIHQMENEIMEEDNDITQSPEIILDKYDCFCCIKNLNPCGRIFIHEFHFSFFIDREFNTYYVVNDHENCSDEFPMDDTYCQELGIFPEILKLVFINSPSYIGYSV